MEADLQSEYGVDILAFFRGALPWRKLRALLDLLPSTSRYKRAMQLDEDIAAATLDALDGDAVARRPPLEGYDHTVELLTQVVERLEALEVTLVRSVGQSATYPQPRLRPETGMTRVRAAREEAQMHYTFDVVAQAQQRWRDVYDTD